jgi:hypothetical protein
MAPTAFRQGIDQRSGLVADEGAGFASYAAECRHRAAHDGGREIRLRRITEPTAEQKSLLHQIGLSLPERLKSLSKCSADLATA